MTYKHVNFSAKVTHHSETSGFLLTNIKPLTMFLMKELVDPQEIHKKVCVDTVGTS